MHGQKSNANIYLQYEQSKSVEEKLTTILQMCEHGFKNKYITVSSLYYQLNKKKEGYIYLKKAISTGETLDRNYVLASIPEEDLVKIKKEYTDLRAKFYMSFNEEAYNLIKYMYNTDQYLASENFYGGRKEQHPIRRKVFQNNLTILREYLLAENKNSLPQYSEVGNLTRDVTLIMMHHTRTDPIDSLNFNFFEPILKEEVLHRQSYSPYTYVQFVDNMQLVVEEGMPQVYGHFRNYKTNKIFDLKYPEKVDILRAEIGLQPLKEYAVKNGFTLPDNYIEQ
jgi:hypothetical protein